MEKKLLSSFYKKSPIPYAYQKIILDEREVPCDYEILDVNDVMATIMGLKTSEIVGKRFRELFKPRDEQWAKQWIQQCGDVALNNKTLSVDAKTIAIRFPAKSLFSMRYSISI